MANIPSAPEIDFVIAWVDGADSVHSAARRQFALESENAHRDANEETRFHSSGEIYYLIASILKYAPFVRRVHIITDNQKPALLDSFAEAGLCAPDFLKLVSHDVIFRGLDAARPTFSPRPIEAAMWRIPGLAERFVYSNDDMFLNAPLSPETFFREGKPVLHGEMVKPNRRRWFYVTKKIFRGAVGYRDVRPNHRLSQEKGAIAAGVKGNFFYTPHHPHPLRRSVLEEFYKNNMELLNHQVKYRFRSMHQYNQVSLSNNLEVLNNTAVVEPIISVAYARPDKSKPPVSVLEAMRNDSRLFGCVQSMEKFPPALRAEIHRTLREKFRQWLPPAVLKFSRAAGGE